MVFYRSDKYIYIQTTDLDRDRVSGTMDTCPASTNVNDKPLYCQATAAADKERPQPSFLFPCPSRLLTVSYLIYC